MLQNLTKPQEGETAAESVQIALAASAPDGNNTLISPLHTPEGSRHGSDEPAAAGAAAMPAPAAVEPEAPRLMFKGPRWKRTAVAVHCLLFLSGCVIAAAMMWSVEKPHAAALLLGRLAGPAARAAGEWRVARRLACIFFDDVGVTA